LDIHSPGGARRSKENRPEIPMTRQIRRTRQVAQDLIEIYQYIHERNAPAAERVLDAIEQSLNSLLKTPVVGRQWNSPDPRLEGMRVTLVTPYRNYLIFFRPVSDGIEVYRIVHGARELERIVDEIDIEFRGN
jgi:toxin ParE1/3/4